MKAAIGIWVTIFSVVAILALAGSMGDLAPFLGVIVLGVVVGAVVLGKLNAIPAGVEETQRTMLEHQLTNVTNDSAGGTRSTIDADQLKCRIEGQLARARATCAAQKAGNKEAAVCLGIATVVAPIVGVATLTAMAVSVAKGHIDHVRRAKAPKPDESTTT